MRRGRKGKDHHGGTEGTEKENSRASRAYPLSSVFSVSLWCILEAPGLR